MNFRGLVSGLLETPIAGPNVHRKRQPDDNGTANHMAPAEAPAASFGLSGSPTSRRNSIEVTRRRTFTRARSEVERRGASSCQSRAQALQQRRDAQSHGDGPESTHACHEPGHLSAEPSAALLLLGRQQQRIVIVNSRL
jgi:hypothetical protein